MSIEQDIMIAQLKTCITILEGSEDERYPLVGELSKTFRKSRFENDFINFAAPIIGTSGRYHLEKEVSVALFIHGHLSRKHPTSEQISNKIPYDIACLLYGHRKKHTIVKKMILKLFTEDEEYNLEIGRAHV